MVGDHRWPPPRTSHLHSQLANQAVLGVLVHDQLICDRLVKTWSDVQTRDGLVYNTCSVTLARAEYSKVDMFSSKKWSEGVMHAIMVVSDEPPRECFNRHVSLESRNGMWGEWTLLPSARAVMTCQEGQQSERRGMNGRDAGLCTVKGCHTTLRNANSDLLIDIDSFWRLPAPWAQAHWHSRNRSGKVPAPELASSERQIGCADRHLMWRLQRSSAPSQQGRPALAAGRGGCIQVRNTACPNRDGSARADRPLPI